MKLTLREKAAYGIGAVGKDMVYMLTASYVMYYYQSILGLSATYVGVILMAARVFDAINDPLMGILVAKSNPKWGKFRPWLLSGTILNAVVLYGLFAVPEFCTGKLLMAWFAIVYILWGMTYTVMDIPFWSMVPALAFTNEDREAMSTIGRSCAGVGSALGYCGTMICVGAFGALTGSGERGGYKWFSLMVAVIFIVCEVICCMNIKEKRTVKMETASIGEMFKALLNNDQAIVVVITIVLTNCALYTTSNLLLYFFKYDVGGAGWNGNYTLFTIVGSGAQILAMMLLYPLLRKRFTAVQLLRVTLFAEIVGYLLILLMSMTGLSSTVPLLFIPGVLVFAGSGMLNVMTTLFLANSCDWGEWKNGRRDESVIFSMQTFVVKLASGFAAFVAGISIDLVGLATTDAEDVTGLVQPESALVGLRLIMSIVPILLLIAALVYFARKFVLDDEKLHEIQSLLEQRKQELD